MAVIARSPDNYRDDVAIPLNNLRRLTMGLPRPSTSLGARNDRWGA